MVLRKTDGIKIAKENSFQKKEIKGGMEMTVRIDEDKCIGCSLCTQRCPQLFHMEDDKAVVGKEMVSEKDEACCRQAAEDCPVNAIIVEER